jgi:ribosome-binding factor A
MTRHGHDEGAHRIARLTELLHDELRGIFRDEVWDPVLAGLEVRAVVVSVDYRHLRVHCTLPTGAPPRREVDQHLTRAKPFVRARLAETVDLKRVPEIDFVVDPV